MQHAALLFSAAAHPCSLPSQLVKQYAARTCFGTVELVGVVPVGHLPRDAEGRRTGASGGKPHRERAQQPTACTQPTAAAGTPLQTQWRQLHPCKHGGIVRELCKHKRTAMVRLVPASSSSLITPQSFCAATWLCGRIHTCEAIEGAQEQLSKQHARSTAPEMQPGLC